MAKRYHGKRNHHPPKHFYCNQIQTKNEIGTDFNGLERVFPLFPFNARSHPFQPVSSFDPSLAKPLYLATNLYATNFRTNCPLFSQFVFFCSSTACSGCITPY